MPPAVPALPRGLAARTRARWLWQPDKWVRLVTVADLLGPLAGETVADVGGRGHELAGLLPGIEVTTVNVEQPCDVLVDPAAPLPFGDREIDRVSSTDVLEHLPAEARTAHLAELVRIARTRVVLCFPAGSPTKDASELRTAEALRASFGSCPDFLTEHLAHGLPRAEDVVRAIGSLAPEATVVVLYQDGVRQSEQLLLDAYDAVRRLRPGAVSRSARAWLARTRPTLTARASPDNSRAFVVIDLAR